MGRVRRSWIGVAALIVAIAGLGGWVFAGPVLGTCGVLDRSTGTSGCVARHHVPDLEALPFATMVPIDERHVRLFGVMEREDRLVPIQVVVDLETSMVSGREELPLPPTSYLVVPSLDGGQVAVICIPGDICDAATPQGFVLSVADGSVVAPIERASAFQWSFPGERPVTALGGAWLSDTVSAEPDTRGGSIILLDADRERIGLFAPAVSDRRGAGPGDMAVRVSGSGRYLAMIDASSSDGSRIDIYEVASRRLLNTIRTKGGVKVETNAAWTLYEQHLVLVGDSGEATELYIFEAHAATWER